MKAIFLESSEGDFVGRYERRPERLKLRLIVSTETLPTLPPTSACISRAVNLGFAMLLLTIARSSLMLSNFFLPQRPFL